MLILLLIGEITVNSGCNTYVPFKCCPPFSTCKTEKNDVFDDEADHIYITMPMYNLIEYSDNYSDKSESLWQFKRDVVPANNVDLTTARSESFKYKANLVRKTENTSGRNSFAKNVKLVVPLKYPSNF